MNCPKCNFPIINGNCPMGMRKKEELRKSKNIISLFSILYIILKILIKLNIISQNSIPIIILDTLILIILILLITINYKKYNKDFFFKIYLIILIIVFSFIFLRGIINWF